MNIKTEVRLSVKGLTATWYRIEKQEDSVKLEMYNEGKEVVEGLESGSKGYDLIPRRLRSYYRNVITSDVEDTAKFTIKQSPTQEETHGIVD